MSVKSAVKQKVAAIHHMCKHAFHVAEDCAGRLVARFHLDNGVAEFQRVEKLDKGRHLEPVLFVQAVPLLSGNLQLGGQR